jgi:hypothetical protein
MIDLEKMFSRALPLPACDQVKVIHVTDDEVPLWLHGLGEWESALPILNMVKRAPGVAILAAVARVHSIAYIFEVHEEAGKLRACGRVMLPAPGHEECAEAELRVLMHRAREAATEAGFNFLSFEKKP